MEPEAEIKEKMSQTEPQSYNLLKRTMQLSLALGGIMLSACAGHDEVIVDLPGEAVAVSFHAGIESETQVRASSLDLTALQNESFGVLAYYTNGNSWNNGYTPNFMYNQKINWHTDNWAYSPVKYWPTALNDKVSFFAYAPYDDQQAGTLTDNHGIALSGNAVTGAPSLDFTVNTNSIADQVDLVHASAIDKNKEMVDFHFQHALSRLGFSAKTDGNFGVAVVKVTALSIKGKFHPSGTFNLGNGTWSGKTTTTSSTTYAPALNANANAIQSTAQQLHNDDQCLMLIPQNFEGDGNQCTIEATYSIGSSAKTVTKNIDVNFEQSKAYHITLHISTENTGSHLSITVTPWVHVPIQREFADFEISAAEWVPNTREVNYNSASPLRFEFRMDHPVGAHWIANLSNNTDFALDPSYDLDGSSGLIYTVGIKALKPAGYTSRTTEFFLTVDGEEVDTNVDGSTGTGHRYKITQKKK